MLEEVADYLIVAPVIASLIAVVAAGIWMLRTRIVSEEVRAGPGVRSRR